jgi:poly(3-hydroxybutyrate) depolymerase
LAAGEHQIPVPFAGKQYQVTVYLPAGASSRTALPMVLNLHGTQSTGSGQLQYSNLKPAADVAKTVYGACRNGVEVRLYSVSNGGSTWPGSPIDNGNGTVTHEISANALMWQFFQRYRLAPA